MMAITSRGRVPVARRQLAAEPAKLAVSVLAIAAAVAVVLLLTGLRRGMGEQVTLYILFCSRGCRDEYISSHTPSGYAKVAFTKEDP